MKDQSARDAAFGRVRPGTICDSSCAPRFPRPPRSAPSSELYRTALISSTSSNAPRTSTVSFSPEPASASSRSKGQHRIALIRGEALSGSLRSSWTTKKRQKERRVGARSGAEGTCAKHDNRTPAEPEGDSRQRGTRSPRRPCISEGASWRAS